MIDFKDGETYNDDEYVFYDGILTIIRRDRLLPFSNPMLLDTVEVIIDAEYDDPLSLQDIVDKWPDVMMLIHEDALRGEIFRYGNHKGQKMANGKEGELWEKVGETRGYA